MPPMSSLPRKRIVAGAALVGATLLGATAALGDTGPAPATVAARADSEAALLDLDSGTVAVDPALVQASYDADAMRRWATQASFDAWVNHHAEVAAAEAARAAAQAAARERQAAAPAAAAAAAPAPTSSVEEAIAAWFPDNYATARRIAACESGLNPRAVSPGGGNHGLFQINNVHRSSFASVTGVSWESGIYSAYHNAQFARYLYNQSGWGPWACA